MVDMSRIVPRAAPSRSTSTSRTVPGWSMKFTIGTWNVSQRSTNVSTFSAAERGQPSSESIRIVADEVRPHPMTLSFITTTC